MQHAFARKPAARTVAPQAAARSAPTHLAPAHLTRLQVMADRSPGVARLAQVTGRDMTTGAGAGVVQRMPAEAVTYANRAAGPALTQAQVLARITNAAVDIHERRALAILWNRGLVPAVPVPALPAPGVQAGWAAGTPTEQRLHGMPAAARQAEADHRHPQRAVIGTDGAHGNNVVPLLVPDPQGSVPQHFTGYLHERGLAYHVDRNRDFIDHLAARRAHVRLNHNGVHNRIQGRTPANARHRLTQRVNMRPAGTFGTWEEAHRLMTLHNYTYDAAAQMFRPPPP